MGPGQRYRDEYSIPVLVVGVIVCGAIAATMANMYLDNSSHQKELEDRMRLVEESRNKK